jgi:CHAT domain-containing protein
MRRPRLIAVFLSMIALWGPPVRASDGDKDLDRVVRSFASALAAHDIHAFDGVAAEPPSRSANWRWVRDTLGMSDCFSIRGSRVTIESIDGQRARAIVDVDGTATTGTHAPVPLHTPWSLGLTRDDRGWHIAFATVTAREMAISYPTGTHEWWQTCEDEGALPPSLLAYTFADEASGWYPSWQRHAEEIDHAEAVAREAHDEVMVAYCDVFRSRMAWNQRQFAAAVERGKKGLAEALATGNEDVIAAAHFVMALAEWKNGDTSRALSHLDAASAVDRVNNRRVALASVLLAAFIHLYERDYRNAMIGAQKSRRLSRQYQWAEGEMQSDSYIAQMHDWLHDYAAARDYSREAMDISRRTGNGAPGSYLAEVAFDELNMGDTDHAVEHFREAMNPPNEPFQIGPMKIAFAEALLRAGRHDEAEQQLHEAIDRARITDQGAVASRALTELSSVRLARGQNEQALQLARDALALNKGTDISFSYDTVWPTHLAMGRALTRLGRNSEAMTAFRKSIEGIEAERNEAPDEISMHHFDDKSAPYAELIELLIQQRRSREALKVAERMRSRLLIDALSRQITPTPALTDEELRQQRELEQAVVDLNKSILTARSSRERKTLGERLEVARANLDRFTEEIALTHPDAVAQRMAIEPVEPALPESFRNTALIEYVVTPRNTIALVVRRTDDGLVVRSHMIPIRRQALKKKVEDFCDRLASGNVVYAEQAGALYKLLVGPLEEDIRGATTLAVIPDLELWRLPFQALRRPDGRHLIEKVAVFYAPSLTTLRMASRHKRPRSRREMTLLAIGNPTVSGSAVAELRAADRGGTFGPLPDAEREVRSIAALYGPERSRVYVRDAAREVTFKQEAPRFDILHLATHGLLDDHAPMYSSLLLAVSPEDRDQDGLLETREIMQLHLSADLAVLAACNTGRGSIDPGEGVIGISWAFLMAGCPSTVVTQWEASSASTAPLMLAFHRGLTRGLSKAEALRQAQLEMLRDPKLKHPFYWAPFVLVGMPF